MLNIIGIIALIIDGCILGFVLARTLKSGRFISKKSIEFMVPAFLSLFLLYLAGIYYEQKDMLEAIFSGIQYSVMTFAFRFNIKEIELALNSSLVYMGAFYISVGIAALTTALVVVAFVLGKFVNTIKTLKIKNNPIVIIGFNENAILFYNSIKSKAKYFIIDNDNDTIKYFLTENIKYVISNDNIYKKFIKKRSKAEFVSFLNDSTKELELINKFKEYSEKYPNSFALKIMTQSSQVPLYQSMIVNQPIYALSEESLISKKCQLDNQISNYLDGKQIDYSNAVIKNECEINCYFLGFDNINTNLYSQSILFNQFVKLKNNKYESYVPNYHIYNGSTHNLFFNYTINHIDEIEPSSEYFEFPDKISNVINYPFSINSNDFFKSILNTINNNEESFQAFYISVGDEALNINLAIILLQKIKEWKIKSDFRIFVYVKHTSMKQIEEFEDEHIVFFGMKDEIISYPIIVEDYLDEYVKRRALYYEISNNNPNININDILERFEANDKELIKQKNEVWDRLNSYQKKSNISSAYSIFTKLAMIGITITSDKNKAISENDFFKLYDVDDSLSKNPIPYYNREKTEISPRNAIAFMEHLRWNAFMIVSGYVPMKKDDIKVTNNNGKINLYKHDVNLRIHSCITTDEGLEQYYDFLAKKIMNVSDYSYEKAFEMVENKKYDYMLMDTVFTDIKLMNKYLCRKNS